MTIEPAGSEEQPEPPRSLGAGIDFADPNSPLAPYFLHVSHIIGLCLLCLIGWFYTLVPLWHSDIWGHTHRGEVMWQHRTLPDREPFGPFADPDMPAVHTQWLSQVIYAGILRAGALGRSAADPEVRLARGVEFLLIFHWLLLAFRFVIFWFACRRLVGSTSWANVALVLLFVEMASPAAVQRPQAIGVFLFVVELWVLSRPKLSRPAVAGLPLLFLLWANVHGTFVVGLMLLAMMTLVRVIQEIQTVPTRNWREVVRSATIARLLISLGLSVLAAMANPHGPELYRHIIFFADHPNVRQLDEWRPLLSHAFAGSFWLYLVSWTVLVLFWAASGFRYSAMLLVLLPFGIWPLFQERAMVWWLILVPWVLAELGPAVVERYRLGDRLPTTVPSFRKTLLAVGILGLFLLWTPMLQWAFRGRPKPLDQSLSRMTPWRLGLELNAAPQNRGRWAPSLVEALRNYPDGRFQGRIFTSETLGEYFFHTSPPNADVMVCTHAHVFPVPHWRNCMAVKYAQGDWKNWLLLHRVNLIVIEADLYVVLAQEIRSDPAWQIIEDESSAVPRLPGNRRFVALRKTPL